MYEKKVVWRDKSRYLMGLRMRLTRKRAVVSTRTSTRVERRAATLIELLVVISMIAFLIALLVPSLKRSMELASKTICMHNLREIGQSLMAYRTENDGWLPSSDTIPAEGEIESVEEREKGGAWFPKLFPTYLNDPLILACPADPFKSQLTRMRGRLAGPNVENSASYGMNQFILTAGEGFVADADRQKPSRPHETILLADMGPDDFVAAQQSQDGLSIQKDIHAPYRNRGMLPWDDGFNLARQQQRLPWLTQRHNGGINALTLAGGVRSTNTSRLAKLPMGRYYTAGAAGDCTFCNVFRVPHYSFAKDRLFWWVGPAPVQ